MKKGFFAVLLIVSFLVEAALCIVLYNKLEDVKQDVVAVNACLKQIENNYGDESQYSTDIDYTLIGNDGSVLFKTADDLSESVAEAVSNSDSIVDVEVDGEVVGKMIVHNTTSNLIARYKVLLIGGIAVISLLQLVIIAGFYIYLRRTITEPFNKLNDFAVRVAGGNLDMPLNMDKAHVFGSFTEAFDMMRVELKKARQAEKEANDAKKEMVAKLSHDIKTPVASIKSSSEIGYEISKDEKTRHYFNLINEKSDQVTTLVANLFNSSVNDITEISVTPLEYNSEILETIIRSSDYLNKAGAFEVPRAQIYVDKLRIQQVFDNLFMNSYKYADTDIDVECEKGSGYIVVSIRDKGPGVAENELPLLREKYKRGSNSEGKDGAGLGLYLTDYFMNEMDGKLVIENAAPGLKVSVYIRTVEG
ncbi:MAG: HAMP domain-containing histidine kinase [Clostridiales bacterium]|nr:HAMP domain-containing histidine kinase [Clostridiales bacterium]